MAVLRCSRSLSGSESRPFSRTRRKCSGVRFQTTRVAVGTSLSARTGVAARQPDAPERVWAVGSSSRRAFSATARQLGLITREAGAVLGGAEPGSASHLGAEVGGCPEAAAVGDHVEGRDSLFDEAARQVDALGG